MIPSVGIVILCRMSSSRLPGKILRQIGGRSVLGHILDRIRRGVPDVPIVVATSDDLADDPIARTATREGVDTFRGSLFDVADRFLSAAGDMEWDYAIRVNGDNLWVDTETLRGVAALARSDTFDMITNVPGRAFPKGMSVECVRTDFYAEILPLMPQVDRKHVTSWLYSNPNQGRRYVYPNTLCPEASGLDLALDTQADLDRMADLLDRSGPDPASLGLSELVELVNRPKPKSPWKGPSGPLLIAEIGGNHEGDFEVAKAMTKNAIAAGADCVKFQIYQGDTLVSPVENPDRHKHFKKFELEPEQHVALARMCREAGVHYLSSVWDDDAFDWIDEYLDFYKVGSGDMTAWPVIAGLARRGTPILLSTGLATLDEVMQTVRYIQSIDKKYTRPENLCILQCTAMYPIPDEDAHLRVMDRLRAATGLSVGYSDHTIGSRALRAATAMGAEVLEFHFTDSREGKVFRDHKVSLTGPELSELKDDLKQIRTLMGKDVKTPQPSEISEGHEVSFRRAAYLRRDIAEGETIRAEDVICLRPLHGLDARDTERLIGSTARRPITAMRAIDTSLDLDGF